MLLYLIQNVSFSLVKISLISDFTNFCERHILAIFLFSFGLAFLFTTLVDYVEISLIFLYIKLSNFWNIRLTVYRILFFYLFFKLHFIDYAITVVLIFPPLPRSTHHPTLSGHLHIIVISLGHVYNFFG